MGDLFGLNGSDRSVGNLGCFDALRLTDSRVVCVPLNLGTSSPLADHI